MATGLEKLKGAHQKLGAHFKGGNDDEIGKNNDVDSIDDPARRIASFVDGNFMTTIMTILTIFALWGDNLRLAVFDKSADQAFFFLFALSFAAFMIEFILNTLGKPDFKWSFFFYLDFVATVSLLPDIPWFMDAMTEIVMGTNVGNVQQVQGFESARTARVVRLVRLIRLIRIVKLYSMVSKAKEVEQEERLKAQARAALNAKQAALKRVEASRLGKRLSEMTTRRVIMGVLIMIFVLPYLQVAQVDDGPSWGLSQLFWYGRSDCTNNSGSRFGCSYIDDSFSPDPWVSVVGWKNLVWLYSQSGYHSSGKKATSNEYWDSGGNSPQRLLWLRIPDFENGGKLMDITHIESEFGNWTYNAACSGTKHDSEQCEFRNAEMKTVTYTPFECADGGIYNQYCDKVVSYARFEIKSPTEKTNWLDMLSTLFVCIVLGTLSIQFQNDTQKLVIAPIDKMVNIIKQLAEDPLRKPEPIRDYFDEDEGDNNTRNLEHAGILTGSPRRSSSVSEIFPEGGVRSNRRQSQQREPPQLETKMLETTILKIGGLLQVSFGQAGAQVVGENMSKGDGELNIMMPGKKMQAVFGYCDVRRFAQASDFLQEEVIIYINTIGRIIHGCTHRWGGVANKNFGGAFLVLWRIIDDASGQSNNSASVQAVTPETSSKYEVPAFKMNEVCDRALLAFIKIIAECARNSTLKHYAQRFRNLEEKRRLAVIKKRMRCKIREEIIKRQEDRRVLKERRKAEREERRKAHLETRADSESLDESTSSESSSSNDEDCDEMTPTELVLDEVEAGNLTSRDEALKEYVTDMDDDDFYQEPSSLFFNNVQLALSLHRGWAIEGPIGSDFKIDASYLSPHISKTIQMQDLCKMYKIPIVMSSKFYTVLSIRAKERIRKLDYINLNGTWETEIYTFNIYGEEGASGDNQSLETVPIISAVGYSQFEQEPPKKHRVGDTLFDKADADEYPVSTVEAEGVEYLFVLDQDVNSMQQEIPTKVNLLYRSALCNFLKKTEFRDAWDAARRSLEEIISTFNDGPSLILLDYMKRHNYEPPKDWNGCRDFYTT